MADTRVGGGEKAHVSDVAETAFNAMMKDEGRAQSSGRIRQ
jgi:hypothetical protein